MAHDASHRPRRRGRPGIATSLFYPSIFLATTLSGCATSHLNWSTPPTAPSGGTEPPAAPGPTVDLPKVRAGSPSPTTSPRAAREVDPKVRAVAAAIDASVKGPTGILPPVIPVVQEYPIDLTTSLRLAEVENPLIAEARQRVGEALATLQGARALLFPSLNVGVNLREHTGNLERSSGRILNLDLSSLYFGGGAGAFAAGMIDIPAINIYSPLTDAIFEPLAARRRVEGATFTASATANSILGEVSALHFELMAAEADLRVRQQSATQEAEVARLTRAYADAKQGNEADAERAQTELSLIEIEVRHAEEQVAVASARLAQRLHLDQTVRLRSIAPGVELVTIVDPSTPLPELIQVALNRRPEIGARNAAIGVAEARYRQERFRPLLPTLWLGFSGGAFGGGSNLVGSQLTNFGGRTDFDVQAFWTLRNLGIGNLMLQKQRRAEIGEAVGERARVISEVRSEVSALHAEVAAAREKVDVATKQLASAEEGFREDLERIQNTVGRPIEVVNSLELLNDARVDRIRAVRDYNKAEFRLFVALGSPPPLGAPANAPIPPAPIATPMLPPLASGHGMPLGPPGPPPHPPGANGRVLR